MAQEIERKFLLTEGASIPIPKKHKIFVTNVAEYSNVLIAKQNLIFKK
jgi:hypothetical protein